MDRTWILLTEAAAIIAVISLLIVIVGVVYLALRIRALLRQVKTAVKGLVEEAQGTSETVRRDASELGERAVRLREVLAGSSGRIREGWRASVTRTSERRES